VEQADPSLFRKIKDSKSLDNAADSATVEEQAIRKANEMLSKHSIFNKVSLTGAVGPLNNIKL
jgi:hypothetical protein